MFLQLYVKDKIMLSPLNAYAINRDKNKYKDI